MKVMKCFVGFSVEFSTGWYEICQQSQKKREKKKEKYCVMKMQVGPPPLWHATENARLKLCSID